MFQPLWLALVALQYYSAARESSDSDPGSFSGICDGFNETPSQCAISGSGLPIHGISANCFTDLLVMDQCHGQQIKCTHSLAREGKSLENNANVFQICVWQQGNSDN